MTKVDGIDEIFSEKWDADFQQYTDADISTITRIMGKSINCYKASQEVIEMCKNRRIQFETTSTRRKLMSILATKSKIKNGFCCS